MLRRRSSVSIRSRDTLTHIRYGRGEWLRLIDRTLERQYAALERRPLLEHLRRRQGVDQRGGDGALECVHTLELTTDVRRSSAHGGTKRNRPTVGVPHDAACRLGRQHTDTIFAQDPGRCQIA